MNGQIFQWRNPNFPNDSAINENNISTYLQKDIFSKDTLDIVKVKKQILLEDAILAKNKKTALLGDLDTKGSIIRGVTFGNNQGSSVQSSMDLKIKGRLSKDVSLIASIYDQNLPIQADGYTQTLDEFDKIYVLLDIKKHTKLKAGHIDLDNNQTYFAKYQRRSMGLEFDTQLGEKNKTSLNLSAGIARSEFQRMRFQGIEGNQGPYRLKGKNNELFISIIPDSEQVFIDGIKMKRGEKHDYIINYNTGEITFTTYRPIFRENFITVSYNYTNRNYSRFLVTGGINHQREKWSNSFTWFIENDNKNAPISLQLNDKDKEILALAGNDINAMYAPSGVISEYDVNKILYKKINATPSDYFEYSTDSNSVLYQVDFTYFGENKGDYIIKQTNNNGKIYEYVGDNNGNYKAVRKLFSPKKTHVFSTHSEYLLSNGKIGLDFSLSNRDENLFSSIDTKGNIGYAGRIYADKTFKIGKWTGSPRLEFQHINKQFHILDQINDVEFSRDFNLSQEFNHQTQNRFIFSFNNLWENNSFVNYQFNFLEEKNSYRGIKNETDFGWKIGDFNTIGNFSYLTTKGNIENTDFIKGHISTTLPNAKGSWTLGGSMEHNLRKNNLLNQYDTSSFSWKEFFLEKKIGDSARTFLEAKLYLRDNDSIQNNTLININQLIGLQASSEIIKTKNTTLSSLIHYRKFFNYNNSLPTSKNQDFIIGNIQYNQNLWNDGLRFQVFYELGNGQEAQRDFQYIKVTDGQGVYKWTDYNNDGIQQIDEFEIAEYSDLAQYIRIYTNATRYLPSNKNGLKLSIYLRPSFIFNSENSFFKRWELNFSMNASNSFFKHNKTLVLNPFEKNDNQILKNENILALLKFKNNSISGWYGSYRVLKNNQFILANDSNEEKALDGHYFNLGYQFSEALNFEWENTLQATKNSSQNFNSRNYTTQFLGTKPKLTYHFSQQTLADISSGFSLNKRLDGDEKLKAYQISGHLQWQNKKTSVRAGFTFIDNQFNGNSFSIVGNQMLNGLKTGKNQVWSIYFLQKINSFIELNVNYEGRSSSEKTIHIGNMQIKATF